MNICLFHFGRYDDRQAYFQTNYPLYYKCYESVKREFKDDNIMVFYSYEDVYEKFPSLKEDLNKYTEFLEAKSSDLYRLDLVRCLLTKYLDDMLYIDSDIYLDSSFKKNLLENIEHSWSNLFFEYDTFAIFYSRKPSSLIDVLLKRFTKNYTYDRDEIRLSKIGTMKSKGSFDISKLDYTHYGGLGFIITSDIKEIKKINISAFDFKPTLTDEDELYQTNDGALIFACGRYGWTASYFFNDDITLKDLLITVGKYYEVS